MASEPVSSTSEVRPSQRPPAAARAQPVPIGARGPIYTVTAGQGANAADLINAGMIAKVVGKTTQRRMMVAPPDGPSTSGGKHARQVITIVPVSGQGPSIMCGFIDVAQKAASIRDYKAVSEHHRARTGKELDVSAEEYLTLVHELEKLLKALSVNLSHDTGDAVQKAAQLAQSLQAPESEEEPTKPSFLLAAGVALALAAVVAIILLVR